MVITIDITFIARFLERFHQKYWIVLHTGTTSFSYKIHHSWRRPKVPAGQCKFLIHEAFKTANQAQNAANLILLSGGMAMEADMESRREAKSLSKDEDE